MNQEAFTYCWTDHRDNMLYVGWHKGRQDDEYICSSKWMLGEYNKRPSDFSRQIIAEGTQDDCLMLETAILNSVDAKHNFDYYNQHNGDGKFICKKHTAETLKKISGENAYWHGKKQKLTTREKISISKRGQKLPKEAREKISLRVRGKGNPFYGKHHTEETRQRMHKPHGPLSLETRVKMSASKKGKPWVKPIVSCPHCGKIGDSSNLHRWHFDKCGKRNTKKCPHCGKEGSNNMHRYHFDNCKDRP